MLDENVLFIYRTCIGTVCKAQEAGDGTETFYDILCETEPVRSDLTVSDTPSFKHIFFQRGRSCEICLCPDVSIVLMNLYLTFQVCEKVHWYE